MKCSSWLRVLLFSVCLAAFGLAPVQALAAHANGGGTYFVDVGILSEFQFDEAHVQCKIGHAVLPGGIGFHMFMASTSIGSVSINTTTNTATITGTMVSIVVLRFADGTSATLTENVPFTAVGSELLFEVFSQRYERGSTIVTSNLPFDEWTSVFGSERLTGALLDRLTHHVHILEMNGESFRLATSKKSRRRSEQIPNPGPQTSTKGDAATEV